jgi:hypothetical protein
MQSIRTSSLTERNGNGSSVTWWLATNALVLWGIAILV